MKSKTARRPSHASDLIGRFIPKSSEDSLRAVLRQVADLNRERLNRARAQGRTHVALLGFEHVYRDPDTGQVVLASEAPQRASVDGWELVGHQVHEQDRPVGNFDRAIRDGARRARVQQSRATTVTQATGRAPREARNDRRRGSRRGQRATASSSDDPGPDPEPAERRLCENERCRADISHLGPLAHHCDNAGACKQQAYRDRRTIKFLDEMEGTVAEGLSCVCDPQRNTLEPGHCHQCGRTRGIVTREWVKDPALQSRTLVVTRGLPPRTLKVRPDRELSTRLRRTRRDWKVAA